MPKAQTKWKGSLRTRNVGAHRHAHQDALTGAIADENHGSLSLSPAIEAPPHELMALPEPVDVHITLASNASLPPSIHPGPSRRAQKGTDGEEPTRPHMSKVPSKRTVKEWEQFLSKEIQAVADQKDAQIRELRRDLDRARQSEEWTRKMMEDSREQVRKMMEDSREEARKNQEWIRKMMEDSSEEARQHQEWIRKMMEDSREERTAYLESLNQIVSLNAQPSSRLSLDRDTVNHVLGLSSFSVADHHGLPRDGVIQLQAFMNLFNAMIQRRRCRKRI